MENQLLLLEDLMQPYFSTVFPFFTTKILYNLSRLGSAPFMLRV